jgi:hypothetical protein
MTTAYKIVSTDWLSYVVSTYNNNKYTLKYEIEKTTKCIENSVGIMCFRTLKTAKHFLAFYGRSGIILKIKGIKSKKQNVRICGYCNEMDLDIFYGKLENTREISAWKGFSEIVFFDEVTPIKISYRNKTDEM